MVPCDAILRDPQVGHLHELGGLDAHFFCESKAFSLASHGAWFLFVITLPEGLDEERAVCGVNAAFEVMIEMSEILLTSEGRFVAEL